MASLWQRKKKTTAARPARRRTSSTPSLGALWRRVAGGRSKGKKTKTKKSKSGGTLSRAFRVFSCVRAGKGGGGGRTAARTGRRR
ncbi:uncharacterized protein LOC112268762 [Brachypodium distachyon]|uniref:Uncharacterized protein n=1 Tax=Brachypodium distachyon TaxID=15368 RepID=A0A0Q3L9F3_BRADI|nr:uncharacterized protein LOC112268762 [Brachypodium distachyon]KQJ89173.1 hypothetical protein BRADI_4g23948v3 [Brachypodium distachyon]|eukprot:XP_024310634.1 uncharacterized protein LOC112268762 [Brachypodium distachyon]